MKFFITFLLFILTFGTTFASSGFYSKLNIFENYLQNQKLNIKKIYSSYGIDKSENINEVLKETDELIIDIKKIKTVKTTEKEKQIIIEVIADKINVLSKNTKNKVKREIEKYEIIIDKKKKYYKKVGLKLEKSLLKIIKNVYKAKIEKNENSLKKDKILKNLINLKENIKNLNNFGKTNFRNIKTMKKSFINILLNIKSNIGSLKNNIS